MVKFEKIVIISFLIFITLSGITSLKSNIIGNEIQIKNDENNIPTISNLYQNDFYSYNTELYAPNITTFEESMIKFGFEWDESNSSYIIDYSFNDIDYNNGIYLANIQRNISISNCDFENKQYCIVIINCSNLEIFNCTFSSSLAAIKFENCEIFKIESCLFKNLSTGVYARTGTNDVLLRKNNFNHIEYKSIEIDYANHAKIELNVIINENYGITSASFNTINLLEIKNNYFDYFDLKSWWVNEIQFINNSLSNSYNGLIFNNNSLANISYNTISKVYASAIYISHTKNAIVSYNQLSEISISRHFYWNNFLRKYSTDYDANKGSAIALYSCNGTVAYNNIKFSKNALSLTFNSNFLSNNNVYYSIGKVYNYNSTENKIEKIHETIINPLIVQDIPLFIILFLIGTLLIFIFLLQSIKMNKIIKKKNRSTQDKTSQISNELKSNSTKEFKNLNYIYYSWSWKKFLVVLSILLLIFGSTSIRLSYLSREFLWYSISIITMIVLISLVWIIIPKKKPSLLKKFQANTNLFKVILLQFLLIGSIIIILKLIEIISILILAGFTIPFQMDYYFLIFSIGIIPVIFGIWYIPVKDMIKIFSKTRFQKINV